MFSEFAFESETESAPRDWPAPVRTRRTVRGGDNIGSKEALYEDRS